MRIKSVKIKKAKLKQFMVVILLGLLMLYQKLKMVYALLMH